MTGRGRVGAGGVTGSLQASTGQVPGQPGATPSPTLDDRTLIGRSLSAYFFTDKILSQEPQQLELPMLLQYFSNEHLCNRVARLWI